jgi:GEVED domain
MATYSRWSFAFYSGQSKTNGKRRSSKRTLFFEDLEQRKLMAAWVSQGPFSSINGQVEGITNRPVSGAIHAVIAHPTNPDIVYAGSINGGVWKTANATSASPSWTPTTDNQSSNSIGALAFDQADPTFQTVWAGNGLYGSFGRRGGSRDGLLRTTDGGTTWTRITGNGALGWKNISGIAANGLTIVISVNIADITANSTTGIFRSIDGGSTFAQINNSGATNGLPFGRSFDLVVDPLNPSTLYTSLALTPTATDAGIYKSTNGGGTWARVSNSTMNALFAANTSNAEIAAGRFGEVYASIINSGVPAGLFRSPDGGATWSAMDLPKTNENGIDVGLNPGGPKGPLVGTPDEIAGGQGAIHFSMVADPTNANIVYVGGDRQPRADGDTGSFPNSIGANNFSGRLFRGDASQPAGSQFVHLTHRNNLGAAGGGTASNSAPHADSRDMTFDANGNIIEVDDGGIYRRTNPRSNTGDWFSLNGNIAVTEFHDIAYDSLSNTILGGTQDNGNASQNTAGAAIWNTVSQGDGGDVVIDEVTLAGNSQTIRYTSSQNLGGLTRRVYNAAGTQVSSSAVARTVVGGGAAITPAFRTPLQLNAINPSRIIIQGSNSTYESLDQAATMTEVGAGLGTAGSDQDAIIYGGKLDGTPNPEVLYVGSGATLSLRTTAGGSLTPTAAQPVTGTIRDITVDPDNYTSIALLTSSLIQWSTNAGMTWSNITGNLGSLTTDFRSLAFIPGIVDTIVAGTGRGIFATSLAELGVWYALGTGFPVVPSYEMEYDSTDNILVVGTLGRGAWTLSNVTAAIDAMIPPFDFGDAPSSYLVTSASNGPRHARIGPSLGALRDAELDGQPTANALGDNTAGANDEDGITFLSSAIPGFPLRTNVSAPVGGFLNVWLDADRDSAFATSERLISDQLLVSGSNTLFPVLPVTTNSGPSFIRFRITENAGEVTTPSGAAPNGEVEDYAINLSSPATFDISANAVSESAVLGTVIGDFSTATVPSSDPYTYTFVDGPGSTDNSAFSIVGSQLRLNTALNFETKSSYSVRVRSVGLSSFIVERVFTIHVTNVAESIVRSRNVFYNRSTSATFGNGSGNPINAIDTTKQALLPGQTTTEANYTNYSRGLNGIVIDIESPGNLVGITAASFQFATWSTFPDATPNFLTINPEVTISTFAGGGQNGFDRVKLEFANNAIQNAWLRITMLADANTDLVTNDVYYFGNARFDVTPTSPFPAQQVVINAFDVNAIRARQGQNSGIISNIHDVDRSGVVNAFDTNAVRSGLGVSSLRSFTAPSSLQFGLASSRSTAATTSFDSAFVDVSWLDAFRSDGNRSRFRSLR